MLRPRPALVALALLLVVAGLVGAAPERARGAVRSLTGIVADPTCVPVDASELGLLDTVPVTITGYGFLPGRPVRLTLTDPATGQAADVGSATPDDRGAFRTTVDIKPPLRSTYLDIGAATDSPDDPSASTSIAAPCPPTIVVDPACATPPDDEKTVQPVLSVEVSGFAAGFPTDISLLTPDGTQVTLARGEPDADGNLLLSGLDPGSLGTGIHRVTASQPRSERLAAALFEVPCPEPSVVLEPDCAPVGGPPDRVAIALSLAGFEPGAAVLVIVDPDGAPEVFNDPDLVIDEAGTGSLTIEPYARARGTVTIRVWALVTRILRTVASSPATAGRQVDVPFRFPCRSASPPSVIADPSCGLPALAGGNLEARMHLTLRGRGFDPGPVEVVFDADDLFGAAADPAEGFVPPERYDAEAGADGRFTVEIDPRVRVAATYRIAARGALDGGPTEASVDFRIPCVDPEPAIRAIDPTCGPLADGRPDAYAIEVRGRGFLPGPVELLFDPASGPDPVIGLADSQGRLRATLPAEGRPAGTYTVLARQRDANRVLGRARTTFEVPCFAPTLALDPPSGPPGYAVRVTGRSFPPDSVITLRWEAGLDTRPMAVDVDGEGGFVTWVYLLPTDFLGERTLLAGTPDDPAAFPGVEARYLVQAGSAMPPGGGGGIIDRR